jgi:hypothetical protein
MYAQLYAEHYVFLENFWKNPALFKTWLNSEKQLHRKIPKILFLRIRFDDLKLKACKKNKRFAALQLQKKLRK